MTSLRFQMFQLCKVVVDDFQPRAVDRYQDIMTNVKHLRGRIFFIVDWNRDTINNGMTRKNTAEYTLVELEAGDHVVMNENMELHFNEDKDLSDREQFEVHCDALGDVDMPDLLAIRGSLLGKSIGIV